MLPDNVAGLYIETRDNSSRRCKIQLIADNHGRGKFRRLSRVAPDDMRVGDVTATINSHSPHIMLRETRADEYDAILIHRTRHDGVTRIKVHSPQFFTSRGIVRYSPLRARSNQLRASLVVNDKWCAKSSVCDTIGRRYRWTRLTPDDFSSLAVERDNK